MFATQNASESIAPGLGATLSAFSLQILTSRTLRISKMLTHAGTEKSEDDAADGGEERTPTCQPWGDQQRVLRLQGAERGLTYGGLMALPNF